MIPDSMFENAPEVDIFSDLTEEERIECNKKAIEEIAKKHAHEMAGQIDFVTLIINLVKEGYGVSFYPCRHLKDVIVIEMNKDGYRYKYYADFYDQNYFLREKILYMAEKMKMEIEEKFNEKT